MSILFFLREASYDKLRNTHVLYCGHSPAGGSRVVIYVDVAFAVNLCVDACLLLITASLLRRRITVRRAVAAASVGSLYAVATLFPGTGWLRAFLWKWLCSLVMVDIAFSVHLATQYSYSRLLRMTRLVAAFYAVTFAAAGAVYGLDGLFAPRSSAFSGLMLIHGQIAWWTGMSTLGLVIGLPTALVAVRTLWGYAVQHRRDSGQMVVTRLSVDGQSVELRSLLDTGNTLSDPVTRTPVAVVHAARVLDLLPASFASAIGSGEDPLQALYGQSANLEHYAHRFSIVPYRGVGGQGGYLMAVRPDDAVALLDSGPVSLKPLLIALQLHPLSRRDEYDCILPASVMALLVEGRESSVSTDSHTSPGEASRSSHTA